MTKLTIAYSDDYLNWKLGSGNGSHPTNPARAKLATDLLVKHFGEDVEVIPPTVMPYDREELARVHSRDYIEEVIDDGLCDDWVGVNKVNGYTALQMFAGTARLTEDIISGTIKAGFNPQGAKHHAQKEWSEGFCVLNDFAWAGKKFAEAGLRAVYIDWDVHAGDGVQNLLADTDIPTFSIHGSGIYPTHSKTFDKARFGQTHTFHNPDQQWYNWNLAQGAGDEELLDALSEVSDLVHDYAPDVVMLACGADGHELDSWGLNYTYKGFYQAGLMVADLTNRYADGKILIGGAGGYRPYDATPLSWANSVAGALGESMVR